MLNETETATPGSAMTPSQVRKLKIAIAIMSVLLVAGFILLLAGIYMQTQKMAKKPTASPLTIPAGISAAVNVHVKPGTELTQILADQGRLILHLRHAGGNEIAIIDLASGQEVQRIRLIPQESP